MKSTLSLRFVCLILAMIFLPAIKAKAQQWSFAANYGGNVAGFSDAAKAICSDASGNIYVTGNFNGTINFGGSSAGPLVAVATGTQTDGFVAKFDATGVCQWAIKFGGAATDQGGLGIITDGTKVYVTGQSQFPATVAGVALATVGGSTDGIVFALSCATGVLQWAKAFGGGSTNDQGQSITMDVTGHIYISGVFSTRTTNPVAWFGAVSAFPRTVQGSMAQPTSDLFVAQLDASNGTFNWVSAGGAFSQATPSLIVGNDNVSGSGIVFIPSLNELVMAGSFANSNATYFSNGSATPAFSLTNAGQTDMCILELDLSGNFLNGFAAGGTTNDEALGIAYDAATDATYFTGYYNSASISGAISLTNSSGGFDEIYYARFNPALNTFPWVKTVTGSASGADVGFAIAADGKGNVYVTGRYQGSTTFPATPANLTTGAASGDDVFLVAVNGSDGNAMRLARTSGSAGTDLGWAITTSTNNNIWVVGAVANSMSFTPSSPSVSVTVGVDQELFIARYNDPPPTVNLQPPSISVCSGTTLIFTVAGTAGPLTYQWQSATDAAFTTPVTLTNTAPYSNPTSQSLTILSTEGLSGTYYRAIISNGRGSDTSDAALLTVTAALPLTHTTLTQAVNLSNNYYYATSCNLIARVVPNGASPVSGNVTADVWWENPVPLHNGQPYVQRHVQIAPAVNPTTSTYSLTLYFSQAEFDAFNTAYGSLVFPIGPSDNARKSNIRVGRYNGTSNNASGLPASYTTGASVIIPSLVNWNANLNAWEVSFSTTGTAGFILQVSQSVLPVNLTSFSAQLTTTDVKLNWKTADELNNDHFELERSLDGRAFAPVTQVRAISGTGTKNYDWIDASAALLNTTKLYYRLKIVSLSGSAEYSNTIVVYLDKSGKLVTGIRPNPFTDKLTVDLDMPASGKLTIKLTDINGAIVSQSIIQAPKGFSTQGIKAVQQLSAGVYYLSVSFEGQQYSFKVVKQN